MPCRVIASKLGLTLRNSSLIQLRTVSSWQPRESGLSSGPYWSEPYAQTHPCVNSILGNVKPR